MWMYAEHSLRGERETAMSQRRYHCFHVSIVLVLQCKHTVRYRIYSTRYLQHWVATAAKVVYRQVPVNCIDIPPTRP